VWVEEITFVFIYRSSVSLGIRKIQYAPSKQGRQPCTVVRKDFMLSPGDLELETTLDKQVK
jgi:arrestin-1